LTLIETDRLLLRYFDKNDAFAMFGVFGDPEAMRFGDGAQTEEWIRSWIGWVQQGYEEKGRGPLAVVDKKSEDVIGYCGWFDFPDINGRPEIELDYRLRRSAWGLGYATEAATAVRDFAFDVLGIERLVSPIDPDNVASIAVAKKLGMTYEADVMLEGYTHPDRVYSIEKASGT
jgi:hypothetical protein